MGQPLAPFFRFPFLSDPKGTIAHLQERQIGIFSIDVDSKDFRTRDPSSVHRKVMADLARTKKGIILFHDIQSSTARALPGLLADLKAKGYRVVHLQPKAPATTVAEFDSQAEQNWTGAARDWPISVGEALRNLAGCKQPASAARRGKAPPRCTGRPAASRPAKQGQDWASKFRGRRAATKRSIPPQKMLHPRSTPGNTALSVRSARADPAAARRPSPLLERPAVRAAWWHPRRTHEGVQLARTATEDLHHHAGHVRAWPGRPRRLTPCGSSGQPVVNVERFGSRMLCGDVLTPGGPPVLLMRSEYPGAVIAGTGPISGVCFRRASRRPQDRA
jgi:hypothetical protein